MNLTENKLKEYNLRYVNEDDLCFKRKRQGKGFVYVNGDGKKIQSKNLIKRFEELVIPPAWENVQICKDEDGHIQATGRDSKGRKQYIYNPEWEEFSNISKFNRMIEFGETMPLIRKKIEKDLKKKHYLEIKFLQQ